MAVCLDHQAVYVRREPVMSSWHMQVFAAVLLFVALSFKVWIKIQTTDLGYQLARERERTVTLDMQRRELELQQSVLLRPETLSRMAEKKLGLQALDPRQARKITY